MAPGNMSVFHFIKISRAQHPMLSIGEFFRVIDQYDQVSWQDFIDLKYDATLPDSLLFKININVVFRMNPESAGRETNIVRILQDWNRAAEISQIGPAQITEFYKHLSRQKTK